jgi:acetyltransferase
LNIQRLNATQAAARLPQLAALLQDAVDSGASVGFLPPLSEAEATEYWREVVSALRGPWRV